MKTRPQVRAVSDKDLQCGIGIMRSSTQIEHECNNDWSLPLVSVRYTRLRVEAVTIRIMQLLHRSLLMFPSSLSWIRLM